MSEPCIYCNERKADTRDHVPPACLFAPPRPSNLITVPSCRQCNKAFACDDEYLRTVLCFDIENQGHPDVIENLTAVHRALRRSEARRFRTSFIESITDLELHSEGGIYLGDAHGFVVDASRIGRTVWRILRGLFYHRNNRALPAGYEPLLYRTAALKPDWVDIFRPIFNVAPVSIGDHVFTYWLAFCNDDPNAFGFCIFFYGSTGWVGFVRKPEE